MTALLDAIKKRDILFGVLPSTAEKLISLGKAYQDAGQLSDAIDFFSKAADWKSLEDLVLRASQEGDVFSIFQAWKHLDKQDLDLLRKAAEKAEEKGQYRYALKAYERLGDQDGIGRMSEKIFYDPDVVSERESKVFIPSSEDQELESEE